MIFETFKATATAGVQMDEPVSPPTSNVSEGVDDRERGHAEHV